MSQLKRIPLYDVHVALGARMAEFANFSMPIYYQGILQEHQAVRHSAGLFDISHMGRVWVRGEGSFEFLQRVITNDVKKLKDGKILYTPMCNVQGGIIDDILVYRSGVEEYLLIVNASNLQKDFDWLILQSQSCRVSITDETESTALLAIQGPFSGSLMGKMVGDAIHVLTYYHFGKFVWRGCEILVSRTGYTGEDGFEIMLPKDKAQSFWHEVLELGKEYSIVPIGLGARDTLRLEMRYLLYGHDMDDETSPLEAGLGWTVSFNKGDFIGRQAIETQRQKGLARRLVGFEMIDQAIPRQGCSVLRDGHEIGKVASGSYSPTLNKNIGLAYIQIVYAHVGIPIYIQIRNSEKLAEVVKTPFFKGRVAVGSEVRNRKTKVGV